jgi:hypothetical protein
MSSRFAFVSHVTASFHFPYSVLQPANSVQKVLRKKFAKYSMQFFFNCFLTTHIKNNRNITFSLSLINYVPRHTDLRGSGGVLPTLLTSALEGVEWLTSRLGRFSPEVQAAGTNLIEGWLGPQNLSERCGAEEYSLPIPGIEPRPPKP